MRRQQERRWDEFIEYHVETEQDRLYGKAAA